MSAQYDREADNRLDAIKALLTDRFEELAETQLGPPNPSTRRKREWRWGNKGSRSAIVRGPQRGAYFSHEANKGGGPLDLIMDAMGCSLPSAIQFAETWLGLTGNRQHAEEAAERARRNRARQQSENAAADAADRAVRVQAALRIVKAAEPITEGDPAWAYLTNQRHIPAPAVQTASNARVVLFHRARGAVVFVATNAAGEIRGVQLVHVTDSGEKREDGDTGLVKMSRGDFDGAVVRLPGEGAPLLVTEGQETGMSVWAATGHETWAALGSMSKTAPPSDRLLCICGDDDPKDAPAAKSLRRAVGNWRIEGRNVVVATPWAQRRYDRSDFNDVLRQEGLETVRARVIGAIAPAWPNAAADIPIAEARATLNRAVANFFLEARSSLAVEGIPPIVHAIGVGVGVGKSAAARWEAARLLAELRAKGDLRTVILAVPTHKLGDEQAKAFEDLPDARKANLRAAVWRGRAADDPNAEPQENGKPQKMCLDLDAVREAQSVGARVDTAVCHNSRTGAKCIFHGRCGHQGQKQAKADLWIVAHELLFFEPPAVLGTPAAVIVDEAAWMDGLEGVEGGPIEVALDALAGDVTIPGDRSGADTSRLRAIHAAARAALDNQPDGNLERDAMEAASINVCTGSDGYRLSWRRVVEPGLVPGMDPGERRAMVRAVAENKTAMRLARFFKALEALMQPNGPKASGWISLGRKDTDAGPVRVLRLRGRRKIAKVWNAPTLILDALLDPVLIRPYWPEVRVTAQIEATTPHMRVRQLVDRDWAKSALLPDEWCNGLDPKQAERCPQEAERRAKEVERRLKNSERLRAVVLREARRTIGQVLVVAQKGVVEYWKQCGPLPGNVELAWHNNVAGRDEWGPGPDRPGISLLIVVGRTLPRPWAVEIMAEALTGAAVATTLSGPYERHESHIRMRDGTSIPAEADRHPDPICEAIRRHVCEGELTQIKGRPRGVNRTAQNPVEVLVLTDRPLPEPVDEAVTWKSLEPSLDDRMLSMGGAALESAEDAFAAYGEALAASAGAIRVARCVSSPNKEPLYGETNAPPLRRATYQREGRGKRPASLTYDPATIDDIEVWFEDRVGPLAWLKLEDPPEPPQQPSVKATVAIAAQTLPMPTQTAHAVTRPILLPVDGKLDALGTRLGAPLSGRLDVPVRASPRGGGPLPDRPFRARSED